MSSNNSKYTPEFREETARYVVDNGKSATRVAEEIGIDKNTVCSWGREYRRKNNLPTYAEESIDSELVKRAMGNAIARCKGLRGSTFHSDRGSIYASGTFKKLLEENEIKQSMSRGGCPYDNACSESFFATLKKECVY